jgi:hypothetical protein
MTKRVEFKEFRYEDGQSARLIVCEHGTSIALLSNINITTHCHVFTDPSALDALADAIKRAADALRKSQQVTFGDLERGEFFEFASPSALDGVMRRMCGASYCAGNGATYSSVNTVPVVRLRATFTPVTEGEDR